MRLLRRVSGFPLAFLACGVVCSACCLSIHRIGNGDPANPISIEYASGNPLAILFLVLIPVLALITSIIYWHRLERAACFSMAVASAALIVLAVTGANTILHHGCLFVIVGCLFSTIAMGFAREPRLLSAVFLASCFGFLFMLVLGFCSPAREFGLGYAERAWFFLFFGSTLYDFTAT